MNQTENELKELKIKITEYENKINILKKENTDLNSQLMQALDTYGNENDLLKTENNQLRAENTQLKNEKRQLSEKIQNLEKDINNYNQRITNFDCDLNKYKEEINSLNKIILKKDNEIEDLKLNKLSDLEKDENLMVIIFTTLEEKFYYPIICRKTDIFNTIENKLYEKYPAYKESKNLFKANGINVINAKSLEENNIGNNDIVTLNEV